MVLAPSVNKKICVIAPNWIGDMVMAQSLFKLLKQKNHNTQIDVFAQNTTYPLLRYMPEVDNSFLLPFCRGQWHFLRRAKYGCGIRNRYHQAIILPNSWKSAVVPFFAGIAKRTAWLGEMRYGLVNDWRRLNKTKLKRMTDRFLALGLETGSLLPKLEHHLYPALCLPLATVDKVVSELNLTTDRQIIALCPGAAYGPSKQWPAEHFARVANYQINQGYKIWLLGSKGDQEIGQIIKSQVSDSHCVNLAGKTDLNQAIALLAKVKFVITNDSGLMHIACALKKKVIAIYGSSSPSFTPPLFINNQAGAILTLNLSCSPCFERSCPLKHHNCMRHLVPEKVIKAMEYLV